MIRRVLDRLGEESGLGLPATMGALVVLLMLAGYTSSGALHLNTTSTEDRDSKRALAAADAGRNLALFRLNKLRPADDQCLADAPVAPTGGECPSSSTIDLGNGATVSYRVTPKLAVGDGCRAVSGTAFGAADSVRCITATGTVNGVRRRVAWRVVAQSLFPIPGLIGTDYIIQQQSARIWSDRTGTVLGDLGTNTLAERGTQDNQQRNVILGPGATSLNFQPSQIVNRPAPFDVPMGQFEPVENTNDNANLSSLPSAYWNPTTREFTPSQSTIIVLTGGDYHVCRLHLGQSSRVYVTPGQRVRFFVDSPERDGASSEPQTSCANTAGGVGVATGTVAIGQSSTLAACDAIAGGTCTPGNPANLQIFTYGRRNVTPYDIAVSNSGHRVMSIYAPRSRVHFGNSTEIIGSAVAAEINIANSMEFFFDDRLVDVHNWQYKGRQWNECTAQNGSADPEAGC